MTFIIIIHLLLVFQDNYLNYLPKILDGLIELENHSAITNAVQPSAWELMKDIVKENSEWTPLSGVITKKPTDIECRTHSMMG